MTNDIDVVEFDEAVALALAEAAEGPAPRADVRRLLMDRVQAATEPKGFAFHWTRDELWLPHPVAGIKMRVLALNKKRGYATLLFDVAPGTRFPPHHHGGAEECYVVSGSLFTCGRHLVAGDFVHADADTDHAELWTEEGCRVLLVVTPEDYFPPPVR